MGTEEELGPASGAFDVDELYATTEPICFTTCFGSSYESLRHSTTENRDIFLKSLKLSSAWAVRHVTCMYWLQDISVPAPVLVYSSRSYRYLKEQWDLYSTCNCSRVSRLPTGTASGRDTQRYSRLLIFATNISHLGAKVRQNLTNLSVTRGVQRPREGDRCARGSGECKRSCTEPIRGVRECGRDLICCREDNTDCEISKKCLKYDGECKAKCQGDERHIDDMCKDDDCKCCAAPCKLTEQCRAARGRCVSDKDECDGGTVFKGGCEGRHCYCCVTKPPNNCEISKKCLKYDGECKAKCQGDERHIDDMCKDDDCKCCAAPCKLTEQCRGARGRCVSDKGECDGGTVFKGGCEGRHCYCCVTKPPNNCEISKKCLKYDGECKAKCQGDERHIDDMCKDDDCKCCAAPCKLTEQCRAARGRCVSDKDECDGGTVFKGGCEGRHCYCCVTKSKWIFN
ncbi:tenascin-X-like [Homarus americanus]|uniref:tenascin-X-like n=1 Tax=Homarus americanus TaxID=6706 RepID=UPI001C47DBE8|nr:tenascin-X-like [Homarus americanus]